MSRRSPSARLAAHAPLGFCPTGRHRHRGLASGDGAPRADLPQLAFAPTVSAADVAWRTRLEQQQAEAQAALRVPLNRPVTWQP